jgi:ATP-dependent Lon protease
MVKENMLVEDRSTQTSPEDFSSDHHQYKKRKFDEEEEFDDSVTLTDDEEDYISSSDDEEDPNYNVIDIRHMEHDDEDEEDDNDYVPKKKPSKKKSDCCNTRKPSNKKDKDEELMNNVDIINLADLINKNLQNASSKNPLEYPTELADTFTEEEEDYFNKLSKEEQQIIETKYKSIISSEQSNVPIKFQIISADISDYIKNIALQKYNILSNMEDSSNGEYNKLHNWITNLCKIPFGKYVNMPVSQTSPPVKIKEFLLNTRNILNSEVYGHVDAKDQIVRIVAQWISNPNSKGNVIGIHGNPGVGKTTLIKNGVCKALGLPFAFIPLGGANDSSYLDGHSYTYEGSCSGKIVDVLMKNKYMNPVLYFDELDKVSMSQRGQDIINVLIHLTDPSQNNTFQDKYFSDIELDLSKCLIIFTYNDNNAIDPILKDRMITIHTKDYNIQDKLEITKNHLIPNIRKDFDIENITVINEDINYIIEKTPTEAGVRNLKRSIECIISNMNLECLLTETQNKNLNIDKDIINKYLTNNKDSDINPSLYHLYT